MSDEEVRNEVRALLRDRESEVDDAMIEYFNVIGEWAMRVREKLGLSDKALVSMLATAPPPAQAFLIYLNEQARKSQLP